MRRRGRRARSEGRRTPHGLHLRGRERHDPPRGRTHVVRSVDHGVRAPRLGDAPLRHDESARRPRERAAGNALEARDARPGKRRGRQRPVPRRRHPHLSRHGRAADRTPGIHSGKLLFLQEGSEDQRRASAHEPRRRGLRQRRAGDGARGILRARRHRRRLPHGLFGPLPP